MTRIRRNRRARNALTIGILCGLAGCQHLNKSLPEPSSARNSPPGSGLGLSQDAPSDLGKTLTPAQEADVQIAFARAAEQRGDLDQAMAVYRDALARDKGRADAYLRLAILHDRQGRFRESADLYQKALKLRPGDPEIYCDKGYSLYLQRRWAESEMVLRQSLAIDPSLRRAHNNLAMVLARTNRHEEALAEFRGGGNSVADAYSNLAFALTLDRQWQAARENYKRALAASPSSTTIQARLRELDALVARLETVRPGASRDEQIALASAPTSPRAPTKKTTTTPPRSPSR